MFKKIIDKFRKKKILVIGDVILDRYIYGSVSRISPEAPVPVVLEDKLVFTPGGAANVANNLATLGAEVFQIGKIGNDFEGALLKRDIKKRGIDVSGIITEAASPTITKTRVIAQNQQVVRIDKERTDSPLSKQTVNNILKILNNKINEADAVIISDYGKGVITPEVVEVAREKALAAGIPITVDPKVEHFSCYRNVTCITPNRKEAENAIRNIKINDKNGNRLAIHSDKLRSFEDIDEAGSKLREYLGLESILITLGEHGMRLYEKGKSPYAIDTKALEVFDVTGAGDAVISVFTLALISGADKRKAAELANFAAGVVVGKMGAVAVTANELLQATKR
jgi:D-beta-D-heptose 7-phosphate kinase/D-beta-D-heptose 1-phosphate adenosyltransferase